MSPGFQTKGLRRWPDNPADWRRLAVGSACFLGMSPVAPGSFGALLGVAIHALAVWALPEEFRRAAILSAMAFIAWANHALTPWAESFFEGEDPGHFVLDEVAGYLMIPLFFPQGHFVWLALWGFLLFRVFDIVKLPGARWIDREFHSSWGILLDDIVSGFYAVVVLYLLGLAGVLHIQ